ncbi:SAM domain-containing protein [Psidium guajava]|nr:SAM domain-containing protein [Psidium guajava]
MVKKKQKQQAKIPGNDYDSTCEVGPYEDTSWVIVKKQRITILVPPLPVAEKSAVSRPSSSQVQDIPREHVPDISPLPAEGSPIMPSISEYEKATSLPSKNDIFVGKVWSPHPSDEPIISGMDSGTQSKNPAKVSGQKLHEVVKTSNISRSIKQERLLNSPCYFSNGVTFLHQQLKARNLEKKLQKAGGLSSWLMSLGLGQFVRMFRRRRVNEFQLANMTMKKLKDMGAAAVGPRRKLMHAIDCVCDPYHRGLEVPRRIC